MAVTSGANSLNNSLQLTGMRSAGLMSGLDTASMVKQMSAKTKNKINRQQQLMDGLVWKQEGYRDVISKLGAFKDNYLNSLKPASNLKSAQLMAAFKAISSNANVTANAASGAASGKYTISSIEKLAKQAVIESDPNFKMTDNGVEIDLSGADITKKYNVSITLDGLTKDFSFGAKNGNMAEGLKDAIKVEFGAVKGNNFDVTNDEITYKTTDGIAHNFSIGASNKLDPIEGEDGATKQAETYRALGIENVTTNKITGGTKLKNINFGEPLQGGTFQFEINGKKFSFDKNTTVNQMTSTINGSGAGVDLVFDSLKQKFSFSSKDTGESASIKVTQTSGNLLTSMFGADKIGTGMTMTSSSLMMNGFSSKDMSGTNNYENLKNLTMDVTVNGVTKSIGLWGYDKNGNQNSFINSYDSNGQLLSSAQDKVAAAFNEQLESAFGKDAPRFAASDGKLSLMGGNSSDIVSVSAKQTNGTQDPASLSLVEGLGFTNKQTNRLTDDMTMGDIGIESGKIIINGVEVNRRTTIGELAKIPGLTINYENGTISINDKVELGTPGSKEDTKFAEILFGKNFDKFDGDPSKTIEGGTFKTNQMTATPPNPGADFGTAEKTIYISVNGQVTKVTVPASADGYAGNGGKWKLSQEINQQLMKETGGLDSGARFTYADGKFTLKGQTPYDVISITAEDPSNPSDVADPLDTAFIEAMGFDPTAKTPDVGEAASGKTTLKDVLGDKFVGGVIKVGGNRVEITDTTTLAELKMAGIDYKVTLDGVKFSSEFTIGKGDISNPGTPPDPNIPDDDANDIAGGDKLASTLFGDYYANSSGSTGSNAILTINGVKMESTTNNVVVNGTTIGIGNVDDITKVTKDAPITITVTRDSSGALETVKKFVEDYNAMIDNLSKITSTKRPRSGNANTGTLYEPLTDEQKEGMTEKEIEAWDLKAKDGLLYADKDIINVMTKMRESLRAMSVDGFTLAQMGIKESTDYKSGGKLELSESTLATAFEKNPDKIQELFTNPISGIGVTLEKAINSGISQTKVDGIGSLVALAGVPNTSTTAENIISKQIESYQKTIDSLNIKYKDEQQRYWNKFTYLEKMMAKYNEQASMFAQNAGQ